MSSSFYEYIDSDTSKDTHPNNHGGNFLVQLQENMYLPGQWEVALVEMSYRGQNFPNISQNNLKVVLYHNGKRSYLIKFIATYDEIYDCYFVTSNIYKKDLKVQRGALAFQWENERIHQLEKKHYTWNSFKQMINEYEISVIIDKNRKYSVKFEITDTTFLVITSPRKDLDVLVGISTELQ